MFSGDSQDSLAKERENFDGIEADLQRFHDLHRGRRIRLIEDGGVVPDYYERLNEILARRDASLDRMTALKMHAETQRTAIRAMWLTIPISVLALVTSVVALYLQ